MKNSLMVLLFLLSNSTPYAQDTIHIPIDYPTIQEGINASFNGDVVLVHPGSYYENFNFVGKLITVASLFLTTQDTNYIFQTIIEGDTCQSVIFESGEDSTARLIGFTFQNAHILLDTSGVIYCFNSSPLIMNNRIINNTVGRHFPLPPIRDGGGIACIDASPIIRNNNISNNNIVHFGGGIFCYNSSPTIIDNIIKYDTVSGGPFTRGRGGGIYCDNSSPIIFDNYITDNVSCGFGALGGGIYCTNSSPYIVGNFIKDNLVGVGAGGFQGGGIFCTDSSSLIITNNIISSNLAVGYGATGAGIYCAGASIVTITGNNINTNNSFGIFSQDFSSLIIIDNVIKENVGPYDGVGIYCYNSTALIKKNIITSNGLSAYSWSGGIICSDSSSLTIDSCIISNNNGNGIRSSDASTVEIHNCDITGNSSYGIFNGDSVIINAEYNWWGDASGPGGAGPGIGDSVSQNVDYEPWLTGPIPVELTSFTATTQTGKVILNWTTATETNNQGFEIERKIMQSEGSGEWITIGFREGYGTTTELKEYFYVDDISSITANSLAYRLKQIDFDGSYTYSDEVLVDNPSPVDFALLQNYPNPFNPSTTISYNLPIISQVELVVYNALGESVIQLVNEVKEAGSYSVELNAESLPSGVYLYRLQAGGFIQTKKMILMK